MIYRFQEFQLDTKRHELISAGQVQALSPKAFSLLTYLIENKDRMVSKRELLDEFWPSNVSEAALLKSISLIRKALSENGAVDSIIKTHHGQGYRFIAALNSGLPEFDSQTNASDAMGTLGEQRLAAVIHVRILETERDITEVDSWEKDLEAFLSQAKPLVENHQGQLLHMMIDGFTAAFGLQEHCDDVVHRAVRCAVDLRQNGTAQTALLKGLSLTIGIDAGPVALDTKGKQDWQLPSTIERKATRISQKANIGDILLSKSTLSQLHNEAETEATPDGYRLLSAPKLRAGIPGRPYHASTKFVGRSAELAFVLANLGLLSQGRGNALMLSGPAGIGKTRLGAEVLRNHLPDDHLRLTIQCLPSLRNTPLTPVRHLCEFLLDQANLTPTANVDVDNALLRDLLDTSVGQEPLLQSMSDHQRRQKRIDLLNRLLEAVCQRQALVVILEDVHWIDETSKEIFNEIIQQLGDKAFLLLITSRPTELSLQVDSVLPLSPLNQNDCMDLLQSYSDSQGIAGETARKLVQRCAGNPFFLEELMIAAQFGADPEGKPPETVQAVISVRIGALSTIQRTAVYIIAVIGPPAPLELISFLFGQDTAELQTILRQLIRAGFITAKDGGYSFRHMLINDTAYAMVASVDRKKLHGKIATYLQKNTEEAWVQPERLAWHYQEAGETNQAIRYWLAASRAALEHSTHHETVAFALQGLNLIENDNIEQQPHALSLHLLLATSLTTLKGFGDPEAGQAFKKAKTLNKNIGSAKSDIRITVGLWIHEWVRGNLSESLRHARKLMDLATGSDHPALKLQAHASMGQVLMHLGKNEDALRYLKKGLKSIESAPPKTLPEQNAATSCAAYAAWTASMLGYSEEAENYFQQSHDLAQLFKNPFAQAIHYALCTEYFFFEGDVKRCLEIAEHAVSISRKHNFNFWLGTGLVMKGWAYGQLGESDKACDVVEEGIKVFEATGAGVQLANWYGLQAETQLALGQYSEGLNSVVTALEFAERTEDNYFTPRLNCIAAALYRILDHPELSDMHSNKAQNLAEEYGITARAIKPVAK